MSEPNHESSRPAAKCVVCTKRIGPSEDRIKVEHRGDHYVVCCASCAQKFHKEPRIYAVH